MGQNTLVVSEPVQTNVSSPDVAMGNAVCPAPASSSGQSGPGEAEACGHG